MKGEVINGQVDFLKQWVNKTEKDWNKGDCFSKSDIIDGIKEFFQGNNDVSRLFDNKDSFLPQGTSDGKGKINGNAVLRIDEKGSYSDPEKRICYLCDGNYDDKNYMYVGDLPDIEEIKNFVHEKEIIKFRNLLAWFIYHLRINNGILVGDIVSGAGWSDRGAKIRKEYSKLRVYTDFVLECSLRHPSRKTYGADYIDFKNLNML